MSLPKSGSPLLTQRERKCLELLQQEQSPADVRKKARAELNMYERYRKEGYRRSEVDNASS